MSSIHQSFDGSMEESHRPLSQSERSHTQSVSPKTRVPSLPSSAGNAVAVMDSDPRHLTRAGMDMDVEKGRGITPAKRKLDDRDLQVEELEVQQPKPPPFGANGNHVPSQGPAPGRNFSVSSVSPPPTRTKSRFHAQVPIWAQQYDGRSPLRNINFVLRAPHRPHLNGHVEARGETNSRHASPETTRSGGAGTQPHKSAPASSALEQETHDLLGPWEPSFNKIRPLEEIPKKIADWLFLDAIQHPALQEILSRGIQFEIEAKLGVIISRDTNDRIQLPVASEVLLQDDGRVAFRSSMTEVSTL
jgi:hypothetical protein